MYIARRELRVPDDKGQPQLVKAGEQIFGVEKWDEVARRANINLGWIEKVDDVPVQAAQVEESAAPVSKKKNKK